MTPGLSRKYGRCDGAKPLPGEAPDRFAVTPTAQPDDSGVSVTPARNQRRSGVVLATSEKRKDPSPRWADGAAPYTRLQNADPQKRYVFVYKPQIEEYEWLGYEMERRKEGGVKLTIGNKGSSIGDAIEVRGHVLMSIAAEKFEAIKRNGHGGGALGEKHFDELEKVILKEGSVDPLRGMTTRWMDLQAETSAPHFDNG